MLEGLSIVSLRNFGEDGAVECGRGGRPCPKYGAVDLVGNFWFCLSFNLVTSCSPSMYRSSTSFLFNKLVNLAGLHFNTTGELTGEFPVEHEWHLE